MQITEDYIDSIIKHGLIGSNNGLSTRGSLLRTTSSIEIDKARNQLAGLKSDKSRSTREKAELASIGSQKLTAAIDSEINLTINNLKLRSDSKNTATKIALASDWSESAGAIFAIELSKDTSKAMSALTDKNVLMALSNAPTAITGIQPETLKTARDTFIRNNHPDIEAEQKLIDADVRLIQSLSGIVEGFNKKYSAYTDTKELETGNASSY